MRVQTDDALKVETEAVAERLREELATPQHRRRVRHRRAADPLHGDGRARRRRTRSSGGSPTSRPARSTTARRGAGGTYTFTMKPNIERTLRDEAVTQALQTIERRVNELGVAEPIVAPHGTAADQILVQLPGVTDVNRAKEIIRSTALLELKIVEDGPGADEGGAAAGARRAACRRNMEVVPGRRDQRRRRARSSTWCGRRRPSRAATCATRGRRSTRTTSRRCRFSLNNDGAAKFGRVTQENIGRQLAIILDGQVQSAPVIEARITDEGRIIGHLHAAGGRRPRRSCCGRARCRPR